MDGKVRKSVCFGMMLVSEGPNAVINSNFTNGSGVECLKSAA